MVLAPVLAVAARLRARARTRVAVGVAAVTLFALVTRWEPSVLRASVMAGLALVGSWSGRPRSTGVVLGGACLALLIADPGLARSVGCQLSVAATAGLAMMAGPLAVRLQWLPRSMAVAVAATLAAQAAVTPLLLLHFGLVPSVTLLANVLAAPAVGPALFAGAAASGAALAAEPLGRALGGPASVPVGYLIALADRMARFPLPSLTGSGVAVPVMVGLLVLLGAWRVRRGRRPVGLAIAALAVAAAGWTSAPVTGPPSALEVTFLDVGQGDAAVVRAPDGGTILVDAGPEPDQVATELASLGVRRIDLAVATHAHADHLEGFPAVLARFPVSLLIEPGCPAESPSYSHLLEAVRDEDVTIRHPRGGEVLSVGATEVEVLGPEGCSPGGESPNDESIVLRVSNEGGTVLFPGDAEEPAQEDLLADGDLVQARVLKVPHHGGDTSSPAFWDATRASVAIVSTGPNEYGHPVPSVLDALRARGMQVVRTDLRGDVTVRFTGDGVLVAWSGP